MRVAVIGQGYVGLTAAALLVESGHDVTGVEVDPVRSAALAAGRAPFHEPGLDELLAAGIASGRLRFVAAYADAPPPDLALVCVGTPQGPDGAADLSALSQALAEVATAAPLPAAVVVKSSIPPGTSERLIAESVAADLRAHYVHSPEFLAQGAALAGWRAPARLVIGTHQPALLPLLADLYRGIDAPHVLTTPTNAELIKYTANALLATKISFVNEVSRLCDALGGDIVSVAEAVGMDPRIGPGFLGAGVGYGGSCLPKDTAALVALADTHGIAVDVLRATIDANARQQALVVRRIAAAVPAPATVALLGLSFKPQTDDLRAAPSIAIAAELAAAGYTVRGWDPVVGAEAFGRVAPAVAVAPSLLEACRDAAAAVVLTEWPEVRALPVADVADVLAAPRLLLDGRNCLDRDAVVAAGLRYQGIGRS